MSSPIRRFRAALALMLALALVVPALAQADGDPGSDVLLAQNLFVGARDGVTPAQQVQLTRLLDATARAGAPVRVAIIGQKQDLGAVTALWGRPASQYAQYLATELSQTYSGRLLIVMPNGVGVYWWAQKSKIPSLTQALAAVHVGGSSGAALIAATTAAINRLETAAGISSARLTALMHTSAAGAGGSSSGSAPAPASTSGAPAISAGTRSAKSGHQLPGVLLAVVLIAVLIAYVAFRRGWRPRLPQRPAVATEGRPRPRVRIRPVALLPTALLLIVVAALVVNQSGNSSPSSAQPVSNLSNNPDIDPGSKLKPTPAPNFTLVNQTGHEVSLKQFRGKVVILSFIDAECQTICPLTTEAMLDAKRALGPAAKHVQLLGVNANWKSTQVADVSNYTQLHGMTGQWQFLTGTPKQLGHVWTDYKINERQLMSPKANVINHVAATYIIDPQGRMRVVYTTQTAYAAIPQLGQLWAHEASALLPSHPKVSTHYSYARVRGITPTQTVTAPRAGGGTVKLGPGKPHLYLFFATWDRQTTAIGAELSRLNTYNTYAQAHGLPTATAIDEGSVEPSASALPDFLKQLKPAVSYPVAIDQTGRIADGYNVQGEPWFVLTDAAGKIVWYQEIYTSGWPSLATTEREVKAALSRVKPTPVNGNAVKQQLAGSPKPLAELHSEGSILLSGGATALYTEMTGLEGFPKVINIWGSWCVPCQQEFPLFAAAAAKFGRQVAFLGADYHDNAGNARLFLKQHLVSYPSYQVAPGSLGKLLPGGVQATPTTIFLSATGKVVHVQIGQYQSQGALDSDIQHYALGQSG